MWLDDIDVGGRGIVQPAKGPLGRAVRQLRRDLLISQARLAGMVGASQTAISKLERGSDSWALFCRVVDTLGGRPVVSVERIPTQREVFDAYLAGESVDVPPPSIGAIDNDGWW